MTLGQLIEELERLNPSTAVPYGFGDGCSYRGFYERVAFRPVRNTTVGEMVKHARAMLGTTMNGYKGGVYACDASTLVHLANYGDTDGLEDTEGLTPERLERMVGRYRRDHACPHCGGCLPDGES